MAHVTDGSPGERGQLERTLSIGVIAVVRTQAHDRLGTPAHVVALFLVLLLAWAPSTPASAAEPFPVQDAVTDEVGVVAGSESEIERAFAIVANRHGVRMHVVYVASFDAMAPRAWADQTFWASGMGPLDLLIAVAVTDRSYSYVVHRDFALDDENLTSVGDALKRHLAEDPAQAAVVSARAVSDALDRGPSEEGGVPDWLIVGGFVALFGALWIGPGILRVRRGQPFFPRSRGGGRDTWYGGWGHGSGDSGSSGGTRGGSGSF